MSDFAAYMAHNLAALAAQADASYEAVTDEMAQAEARERKLQDAELDLGIHHMAGNVAWRIGGVATVLHQGLRRLEERSRRERGLPAPVWPDVSIYEEASHA